MDQCPHCGSRTADGSKCPNCGQSLDTLPEYSAATSDRPAVQPAQPAPSPAPEDDEQPPEQTGAHADESSVREEDDAESGRLSGSISRRALLGGAGASVALLGVGGASWLYLQGGAGEDLVRSYVDAMAANNWSQVEQLYHDESPIMTYIEDNDEIDGYEGFLREREVLETWKEIDPELDGIQEFYHATEVSEDSVEDLNVQLQGDSLEMIDELRSVIAFITVEVGSLNEDRESAADYYEDGTVNRPLTHNLALIDEEWHLWTVRGLGRFGRPAV